jgi:hypothetical protein
MPSRVKPNQTASSGLTRTTRIARLGVAALVIGLLGASSKNALSSKGGTVFLMQQNATLYTVPGTIVVGDEDWIIKHAAWTDGHAAWAG